MTAQAIFDFSGKTYLAERDGERLSKQLKRVRDFVIDGEWHTLAEIAKAAESPEASVSARLRDLRNKHGFRVETKYIRRGLHAYRVTK